LDGDKIFEGGDIVLMVLGSESYGEKSVEIAAGLSQKSVCYVTLNKTYESMKDAFGKHKAKMENVVFIDGITKTIRSLPNNETDGCYYATSPAALTEISILVSKCLHHKFEYLVFDSLSNILIYQDKAPLARFVSNLANQARANKARAIFYVLESERGEEVKLPALKCGASF